MEAFLPYSQSQQQLSNSLQKPSTPSSTSSASSSISSLGKSQYTASESTGLCLGGRKIENFLSPRILLSPKSQNMIEPTFSSYLNNSGLNSGLFFNTNQFSEALANDLQNNISFQQSKLNELLKIIPNQSLQNSISNHYNSPSFVSNSIQSLFNQSVFAHNTSQDFLASLSLPNFQSNLPSLSSIPQSENSGIYNSSQNSLVGRLASISSCILNQDYKIFFK